MESVDSPVGVDENGTVWRARFEARWRNLPGLTVVLGAPGWSKSVLLDQCAQYLRRGREDARALRVRTLDQLATLTASGAVEPGSGIVVVLVDGMELDLAADESLWGQVSELAAGPVPVIVAAIDFPTAALAADVAVIDEHELAFDQDESQALVDGALSRGVPLDMLEVPSTLGAALRWWPATSTS